MQVLAILYGNLVTHKILGTVNDGQTWGLAESPGELNDGW